MWSILREVCISEGHLKSMLHGTKTLQCVDGMISKYIFWKQEYIRYATWWFVHCLNSTWHAGAAHARNGLVLLSNIMRKKSIGNVWRQDKNLRNYSSACKIYFCKFIRLYLLTNLLHSDWKKKIIRIMVFVQKRRFFLKRFILLQEKDRYSNNKTQ